MSFLELARERVSIRKYKDIPVEEDKLMKVLEAGRLAPSACNNQPWHFIVITEKENRERLKEVYPKEWFYTAPVIICVCGDHSKAWVRSDGKTYCDVDIAIAMDHITLEATELGLGTCWIGAFNAKKAREVLKLPENLEPIVFTPLGYPDESGKEKNRKHIQDILSWEFYGGKRE